MTNTQEIDAIVIGAGFAGIYQAYALRNIGLNVKVLEKADSIGGTWFYNRYPGATSDTPSHLYRYSWDKEDLLTYKWSESLLVRDEVLAYLHHVVDRNNLRSLIQLNTTVKAAEWQESTNTWLVTTNESKFITRYLVGAVGLLSEPNWPDIPGREQFRGELYHTSRWPDTVSLEGKRVAVIGNGSTGVQLITNIAKDVGSLICFQRRPQFSVPIKKYAVSKEERDKINTSYDDLWAQVRTSIGGVGTLESKISVLSVSEEERQQIFEEAWNRGPFDFSGGAFNDLRISEAANEMAVSFLKNKIRQIVKDPQKAEHLMPDEGYVRRPVADLGYYEQFNRPNVDIVKTLHNSLASFTDTGMQLSDGTMYEFDVVICATGFSAFTGAYNKIGIQGRNGLPLKDYWEADPVINLGVAVANFPNFFTVVGPKSPISNIPPLIEAHVDFITAAVRHAETLRHKSQGEKNVAIETTKEAEERWSALCEMFSEKLLFRKGAGYFYGAADANGKRAVLVYQAGLGSMVQQLKECEADGFKGFRFTQLSRAQL